MRPRRWRAGSSAASSARPSGWTARPQPRVPAQRLEHQRERLNSLRFRLASAFAGPQGRRQGRVNLLAQRLAHCVPDTGRAADRLNGALRQLGQAQARLLAQRRDRLAAATAQLRALDQGNTLARGYAIARDDQGRIVRDAARAGGGAGAGPQLRARRRPRRSAADPRYSRRFLSLRRARRAGVR